MSCRIVVQTYQVSGRVPARSRCSKAKAKPQAFKSMSEDLVFQEVFPGALEQYRSGNQVKRIVEIHARAMSQVNTEQIKSSEAFGPDRLLEGAGLPGHL